MISDPYAVLGVSRTATPEEIKKAYRTLAKKYHPDLHPDDPVAAEKMNEINQAYDMINNPDKYRQPQPGNPYGTYTYNQNTQNGSGSYGSPFGNEAWDAMFEEMFRNMNQGQYQNQGQSQDQQKKYNGQYRYYRYDNTNNKQTENNTKYRRTSCLGLIIRIWLIWIVVRFLLFGCSRMFYRPIFYYEPQMQEQHYDNDKPFGNADGKDV